MTYLIAFIGLVLVLATLLDAFEVVLLPRPVRRRLQVNRYFFRLAWAAWSWLARRLPAGPRREDFIGVFGPLSMVSLFGAWALLLIIGFALMHWALPHLHSGAPLLGLTDALVVSGDAFFTLGYGDVVPHHAGGRLMVIVEAGTGFGFIALTIAYLPVLYQHFSRRDCQLIDLSLRAGTPPAAAALLEWHVGAGGQAALTAWLRDWELWASELVESHSAYPMLSFYRSQHSDQSWLAALAVVMDTCALLIAGARDGGPPQAAATFAAARRALRVASDSLDVVPAAQAHSGHRAGFSPREARALCALLPGWDGDAAASASLQKLRGAFMPLVAALADHLMLRMDVPDEADPDLDGAPSRDHVVRRLAADDFGVGRP
ncbi:MAG: two pore domain potassium channel family protein [Variovorax sp.]|nr:MAG: two pore domain potassium channel family protein [Variovorax sp.]